MQRAMKRFIAFILICSLLFSTVSAGAIAAEEEDASSATSVSESSETQETADTSTSEAPSTDNPTPESSPEAEEPETSATQSSARSAAVAQSASGSFAYTVLNGTYCQIDSYTGTETTIQIPTEIDGYVVQSLGDAVFQGNTTLTGVVFPETVVTIGSSVFAGCTALSDVRLNEGLLRIPSYTFDGCTSLTSITLPSTITSINTYAFRNCSGLTEVNLAEGLTTIYSYAFENCTALEYIDLPDTVTTIAGRAFYNCTGLSEVGYPAGWITVLDYYRNSSDYYSEDSSNYTSPFQGCSSLTSIEIPEGVTAIPKHAFRYLSSLEEVTLPESLTAISGYAFDLCSSLNTISLSDGLESIGTYAFSGCTALTEITFPDDLATISSYAFTSCTGLTEISLPTGMTKLNDNTFNGCTGLQTVTVPPTIISINSYAFYNCTALSEVNLAEGLTTIYSYAFENCTALESIDLPDTVTTLAGRAFYNCTGLSEVGYPAGWTTVLDYYRNSSDYYSEDNSNFASPFQGCSSLTSIEIPEGVTAIPKHAFRYLSSLEEVTLPESLTAISGYAFDLCSSLNTISLPDGLESIGKYAFSCCTGLTEITFPDDLATISSYAFNECTGLRSISIPDGMTTISRNTFDGCTGLQTVTVPPTIISINSYAFYNCTALSEVNLAEGLTTIYSYAFENCTGLVSIDIPDTVTTLAGRAFYNCTGLSEVGYPAGWTTVLDYYRNSSDYYSEDSSNYTSPFQGCSSLTSIEIPEGVTAIPKHAFRYLSSLEEVTLPESLTAISGYAFDLCSSLDTILLTDGLESIGKYAFSGCIGLTNVDFPSSLTSIGSYVFNGCTGLVTLHLPGSLNAVSSHGFEGCTGLRSITMDAGIPSIYSHAFAGCTGVTSISLPDGLTTIYSYAFENCTGLVSIDIPNTVTTLASRAFYNCSNLAEVGYPAGWTTVLDYYRNSSDYYSEDSSNFTSPFQGCFKLKKVQIPEGITVIPKHAFRYLTALEEVILPDSLTSISSYAFNEAGLKSVSLPETITSIGSYSFYGCSSLKTAYIPNKVEADTTVGTEAFHNCSSDLTISCYNATNAYYYAESAGINIQPLDAHEHSLEETAHTSPTCLESGYSETTCSICGYRHVEVLDALGHDFAEEFTIDRAATCLNTGRQSRHCSRCIVTTDDTVLPATGHNFSSWLVTEAPTVMKTGTQVRNCQICGLEETETVPCISIPEGQEDKYGIVTFHVVDAQELTAIANASITLDLPSDDGTTTETLTLLTGADGYTTHVLPVGKLTATVAAAGCLPRTLNLTIKAGEQTLPDIGVSARPPVEAEITHHLMTYDEIVAAGIDVNDPSNQHVYKYKLTLTFHPEIDIVELMYYFNMDGFMPGSLSGTIVTPPGDDDDDGGGGGDSSPGTIWFGPPGDSGSGGGGGNFFRFTLESTNEEVTVYPVSEKFFLIIYGEVHWLKEMFDVEMLILNNSQTDTVENCVAELTLPEGLSLAAMVGEEQMLRREVGTIEAGGTKSLHWYVRGDVEGTYDITASLSGTMMPFEEDFFHIYTAEDPLKVYAGSAMHLTFEVPSIAYYKQPYTVKITLENVSDRTLYNVTHMITNLTQSRVTYYSDGSKESEVYLETGYLGDIGVTEFKPGDKLVIEITTEIMFQSELIKYQLEKLRDGVVGIAGIFEAISMFDTAIDAADSFSGFLGDLDNSISNGGLSLDDAKTANSFNQLFDYMEFGEGDTPAFNSDSIYNFLNELINVIPIRFVLDSAVVTTLDESTTTIPSTVIVVPANPPEHMLPAGSLSMTKLAYSIAILAMGRQDVGFCGVTLWDDVTGYDEAYEYVKSVVDQARAIRAEDATGETTFKAWVEYANTYAMRGVGGLTLSTNNETAVMGSDGVLTFTGPGIIEVIPHNMQGGTVYVQAGDQEPKCYEISVIEAHECASDDWIVAVPPTDTGTTSTVGYKMKKCDICDEIFAVEQMVSCGDHAFGDYLVELEPNAAHQGIQTRTCTKCGVLEYEIIDASDSLILDNVQMLQGTTVQFPMNGEFTADLFQLQNPDGTPASGVTLQTEGANLILTLDTPLTRDQQWILVPSEDLGIPSCTLTVMPEMDLVTDLLTEASGTVITKDDIQYLVLPAPMTVEEFQQTMCSIYGFQRTNAVGAYLDPTANLATGQQMASDGLDGVLTLVIPGDLNGDGMISKTDAEHSLTISAGKSDASNTELFAADSNGDGSVSLWEISEIALLAEGSADTDSHQVVLGVYNSSGKLIGITYPTVEENTTVSEAVADFEWNHAILFTLEQLTSTPLTSAISLAAV